MSLPPATEEIYEAILDDDLFEALPGRIAQALGARSVLMHWHYGDGDAAILSHSGYFSDAQLQLYAAGFAARDPWAAATAGLQPNGFAMNLEEIVPEKEFERSDFYNDYIRAIGDDTFRCMGIRSDTQWGSGMIAVQRGRRQPSFDAREVQALQAYTPHLRRLLVLRGRLLALERGAQAAARALDLMRDAAIVAASDARLVHANAAGEALLASKRGLGVHMGLLGSARASETNRLRQLIAAACGEDGGGGTVLVDRGDWPPLAVAVAPLRPGGGVRQALLLVHETAPDRAAVARALRRLFRLTRSEADVALQLADGRSVSDIAGARQVSLATVRGQVKALFAKLGCTRQAEVVILVKSIPVARHAVRSSSLWPGEPGSGGAR